ncbi:uncharacterized protein LOC126094825 [Schistocerca cancellata]|uniref:uncharacterized protein LOC126094825 n=1 Tax=Schistocerca cancellata TaxID=274614 RepID=UPI0021186946|nr:uncharacterized protein LOC126094825 [Schistocerca cancellata]
MAGGGGGGRRVGETVNGEPRGRRRRRRRSRAAPASVPLLPLPPATRTHRRSRTRRHGTQHAARSTRRSAAGTRAPAAPRRDPPECAAVHVFSHEWITPGKQSERFNRAERWRRVPLRAAQCGAQTGGAPRHGTVSAAGSRLSGCAVITRGPRQSDAALTCRRRNLPTNSGAPGSCVCAAPKMFQRLAL